MNTFYIRICFAHGIHESFYCSEQIKETIVKQLELRSNNTLTITFGDNSLLVINPEFVCLTDVKPSYNPDPRISDEVKQFGASRTN